MTEKDDEKGTPRQDWNQLAKQALDLWQGHLSALSKDEKAKADMANMMRPMTQMATQWAEMVQSSLQGVSKTASQATQATAATEENVSKPEEARPATQPTWVEDVAAETQTQEPVVAAQEDAMVEDKVTQEQILRTLAQEQKTHDLQSDESAKLRQSVKPESVVEQPVLQSVEPAQPVAAKGTTEPKPELAVEPSEGASGRSAFSTSAGDLADIAARLAQLEQELDTLRPHRRSAESDKDIAAAS